MNTKSGGAKGRWVQRVAAALLAMAILEAAAFGTGTIDPYPPKTVYEYFNTTNGHYALLSDPTEVAGVDAGVAGAWVRTGYSFAARNEALYPPNVCRFYAPRANSHFFTANAAECEFLRTHDTGWLFEKLDFSVALPAGGVCPSGLAPVFRMYNDRWAFDDSNHRFSADPVVREDRIARGWLDEGVAFCAQHPNRVADKSFRIETEKIRPSAECEDESLNVGSCIALNQIPSLVNEIVSWMPPGYVTFGPQYSQAFTNATGFDGNVYTGQPPFDTQAVLAHSFAQTLLIAPDRFGLHVNSIDRTSGELASINPLYQFRTSAPAAGQLDARVFPWPGSRDSDLIVSFDLNVKAVRRLEPSGHAYGHPTLQFRDTASGNQLYVTVQAYGTVAPTDFTMVDASTGRVIVSTSFRDAPAFGRRIIGDFLPCAGDGPCERTGPMSFGFRINRAEFAAVLSKARASNPALSANPADYHLANYHFNNEVYRGAEIGASISLFTLEIYPAY